MQIKGCFGSDDDFDGPSYQNDWPGTNRNAKVDQRLHPEPVLFTSPTTGRGHDFPTIAFEADLPIIENDCSTVTGVGCVNPPPGSQFYPFFSNRSLGDGNEDVDFSNGKKGGDKGSCIWQEGGDFIPGTIRDFGGSAATEFGQTLLSTTFPRAGFTLVHRFENFNSGDLPNPCTARNDR